MRLKIDPPRAPAGRGGIRRADPGFCIFCQQHASIHKAVAGGLNFPAGMEGKLPIYDAPFVMLPTLATHEMIHLNIPSVTTNCDCQITYKIYII